MKSAFRLMVAILLFGAANIPSFAQFASETDVPPFHFPLEVGTVWVYEYKSNFITEECGFGCPIFRWVVVEKTVTEQDGECGRIESVHIRNGTHLGTIEFSLCMKGNTLTRMPGTSGGFPLDNSDKLPSEVLADFNQPLDTYWPVDIEGDMGQTSQPAWKVFSHSSQGEFKVETVFCDLNMSCSIAYFAMGHTYRDSIGFVAYYEWHNQGVTQLSGAVIDGVVVGDTTFYTGTSIDRDPIESPVLAALTSAYPNPFNPSTVIGYRLSGAHGGTPLRLSVHDLLGREVAVLFDGMQAPGAHTATFDATHLPSGVYVVVLRAGITTDRRMVSLVK